MPKKKTDSKEMTYEEAMNHLESTVARLEKGDLPLEALLETFSEGIGLVKLLHARLDDMEKRMVLLTTDEDGSIMVTNMDSED